MVVCGTILGGGVVCVICVLVACLCWCVHDCGGVCDMCVCGGGLCVCVAM